MPKQRQRIVFCDCLDCAESEAPRATDVPTALSPAGEAAARQDPPPKCLLVVLSGALQPAAPGGGGGAVGGGESAAASTAAAAGEGGTVLDSLRLPHLDRAARAGCQGLLVVREGSAAEPGAARPGAAARRRTSARRRTAAAPPPPRATPAPRGLINTPLQGRRLPYRSWRSCWGFTRWPELSHVFFVWGDGAAAVPCVWQSGRPQATKTVRSCWVWSVRISGQRGW